MLKMTRVVCMVHTFNKNKTMNGMLKGISFGMLIPRHPVPVSIHSAGGSANSQDSTDH